MKVFLFNDLLVITNNYVKEKQIQVLQVFKTILCNICVDDKTIRLFATNFTVSLTLKDEEETYEFSSIFKRSGETSTTLCDMCHDHIQPGRCCICSNCNLLICDQCGATYAELARRFGDEVCSDDEDIQKEEGVNSYASRDNGVVLCRSCYSYIRYVASPADSIQKVIERKSRFIRPSFPRVLNDPYDPLSKLPAGWGSALTEDGKCYFFNPLLWLSSWSLPKENWENDCPIGYAKYYDRNGIPFYYDAKTKKVVSKLGTRECTKSCSCCGYLIDRCCSIACPCCNSIVRSFTCSCLF